MANGSEGIYLHYSDKNIVIGNYIANNTDIGISLSSGANNTITLNTIINNYYGISIFGSENNVYLNSFINNTYQVSVHDASNTFDNGTYGNYWSDYTGTDANGDLIGDTPYSITGSINDNYPLMGLVRAYNETIHYILYYEEIGNTTIFKIRVIEKAPLYIIIWYMKDGSNKTAFAEYRSLTKVYSTEISETGIKLTKVKLVFVDNPPVIRDTTWEPRNPTSYQSVTITADITDDVGIANVILSYYDGTYSYNTTMCMSDGKYIAKIPSYPSGTTIIFKVYVEDIYGQWTVSDDFQITFDNPPKIWSISWSPSIPTSSQDVNILANITDDISVSTVILSYHDTQWHNITMKLSNLLYSASIPSHSGGTTIVFKIYVMDSSNHWTISDEKEIFFDDPPKIF